MTLSYNVILQAIPKAKGFVKEDLLFQTVTFIADTKQSKGLFIPFYEENSGDLSIAIANGAIGAIWEEGVDLPSYTPNHFPIFYTKDLKEGILKMIEIYEKQLQTQESTTKFIFLKENSLHSMMESYDIPVIREHVLKTSTQMKGGN
ncbi:hypothetical protein ACTQ5K_03480 [Niallia sp. Sow4_A1]|uniref:Uncharacterized protein n=1 Tax=Niallia hominis TaxID=3133173 RepID=A0ABV1ET49_9BACI|nr:MULTISPECIES: hypothetical protein [Bacillaceae]MCM3360476.1 hypothetical protein [Niallia sp. MER TA 168]CAI9386141.1 hypothetical protein BACSP_01498 [Bacillus sp. T2.9-1]